MLPHAALLTAAVQLEWEGFLVVSLEGFSILDASLCRSRYQSECLWSTRSQTLPQLCPPPVLIGVQLATEVTRFLHCLRGVRLQITVVVALRLLAPQRHQLHQVSHVSALTLLPQQNQHLPAHPVRLVPALTVACRLQLGRRFRHSVHRPEEAPVTVHIDLPATRAVNVRLDFESGFGGHLRGCWSIECVDVSGDAKRKPE